MLQRRENILHLLGIEPQLLGPSAQSLVRISTELSRLRCVCSAIGSQSGRALFPNLKDETLQCRVFVDKISINSILIIVSSLL